jgi:sugar-specific transcriptional regulator TrmB
LSQERVLKTLMGLGFSQADAEVYVFLSKKGLQKGRDISNALKMNKQQLYPCLKNLQSKGIVSVTLEHPARFAVAPFEAILDLFVKAKMEEVQRIQQSREEILSDWQSIIINATDDASARFMVLEGRNTIYSKIRQMITDSKNQILTIATIPGLVQADQMGLFDAALKRSKKSEVQFRFLAELNEQNANTMKKLLTEVAEAKISFQGRNPHLGARQFPRIIIEDEDEILFFLKPMTDSSKVEQDDTCLWTNCKTLVSAFTGIFEELWRNSTEIHKRLAETENGNLTPKVYDATNSEKANKEYLKTIQAAEEEILLITSSEGLRELSKNIGHLKKKAERGISVKVMAPLVRKNLHITEQLAKFNAVRHVPTNYIGVTIVDGKHLFQFTISSSNQNLRAAPHFYSNNFEYVEKMRKTLNDTWKNAQPPSAVTLESITEPYGPAAFPLPKDMQNKRIGGNNWTVVDIKPPGIVTEKDVLAKINNATKHLVKDPSKDVNVMYASAASAIVHPPAIFNLPEMLFVVEHIEKQSSFGEGDALEVHLLMETSNGSAFIAAGGLGDNPQGVAMRKTVYPNTPFQENYQLVKKDELQIRVYGNTLFAGWAVPIPLMPPKYILPPGCIMFEGYGDVKTQAITIISSTGAKHEREQNWFDAFVTFMHPASKYSGPGTDGAFIRDRVVTMIPLQKQQP